MPSLRPRLEYVPPQGLRARIAARCCEEGKRRGVVLPGTLACPRTARAFVRARLAEWGVTHIVEDAELVVSELATNAMRHTVGPLGIVTAFDGTHVIISVTDSGPRRPIRMQDAGIDDETGRGLLIVHQLADRWGKRPVRHGMCVWAHLSTAAGEAPQ